MLLSPATTPLDQLLPTLQGQGYAVLGAAAVAALAGCTPAELEALRAAWNTLPPDAYLKDGGHYRRRRHASFVADSGQVTPVPHRAHWQPVQYNALHGGMERWFDPVLPEVAAWPAWTRLLQAMARVADGL